MFKKIKKFIIRLDSIGLETERNLFVENVALLISAGLDISSALFAIKKETKSRPMKRIIGEIEDEINSGSAFWRALDKTKIFTPHTISLVKIGEESGRLEANLKVIAIQGEKDKEFRSKLHSAMMYPTFVFGLTMIIGVVVAWFILPRLSSVFSSMKMELPMITRVLIAIGTFLEANGAIFIPLFVSSIFLLVFILFYFPKTKFIGQEILFHIPGTRKLIQQIELSRFGYMLGTLMEAGITVNEAMHSLIEASTFAPYKNFYEYLLTSVEDGNSFQKSFSSYSLLSKIFPPSVQQMVVNGEQSGFLTKVLKKIGTIYEKKIESTTKNLTVILEPVLLVIVWLGVVAVAMAVILPIYSLVGGFGEASEAKQAPRPAPAIVATIVENETATSSEEIIKLLEEKSEESLLEVETKTTLEISAAVSGALNVRTDSSGAGEVISTVRAGEVYEYTEKNNGWHKIILPDGGDGWVFSSFVNELN